MRLYEITEHHVYRLISPDEYADAQSQGHFAPHPNDSPNLPSPKEGFYIVRFRMPSANDRIPYSKVDLIKVC